MIELDSNSPTGLSRNGRPLGSKTSNGLYWRTTENGKQVYCHRRVWELANGPISNDMTVDHINRDGLDNRVENLRLASKTLQIRNRKTSWGEVPYKWVQKSGSGRYRARWRSPEGVMVNAGTHSTPLEAHLASCASRLEHLWSP